MLSVNPTIRGSTPRPYREGDLLNACSVGELRDLLATIRAGLRRPYGLASRPSLLRLDSRHSWSLPEELRGALIPLLRVDPYAVRLIKTPHTCEVFLAVPSVLLALMQTLGFGRSVTPFLWLAFLDPFRFAREAQGRPLSIKLLVGWPIFAATNTNSRIFHSDFIKYRRGGRRSPRRPPIR